MRKKFKTSVALSAKARSILQKLSSDMTISRSAVIEVLLREHQQQLLERRVVHLMNTPPPWLLPSTTATKKEGPI